MCLELHFQIHTVHVSTMQYRYMLHVSTMQYIVCCSDGAAKVVSLWPHRSEAEGSH